MTDAGDPPPTARSDQGWRWFRSLPWWAQAIGWCFLSPVTLVLFTLSKPADARRPWWAVTVVASLVCLALVGAGIDEPTTVAVDGPTTTTAEVTTTTTEQQATTTTIPAAPEGGTRSGDFADVADGSAVGQDKLIRTPASSSLLATLATLKVEPEHDRSGYDRALFPQWDDVDGDGCDTRCEVLSAQRRSDGTWLSLWDGYSTNDPSEIDIDHVVALAEAWDSGADTWGAERRDVFADSLENLLAVSASSNARKSDRDAAEWFPSRPEANCLWASTVVRVKAKWQLSVDRAEHDALVNLLHTCGDYVPPTTTTVPPTTTTTTSNSAYMTAPGSAAPTSPPPSSCTPGYDPCIPLGDDVDCDGGGGDGPRFLYHPVRVTGDDPYGLDGDGDGWGCT